MRHLLPALILLPMVASAAPDAYQQEVEAWRAGRLERLTAPAGWLSLVGLHWLPAQGRLSLGNGPGNEIDLGHGPARLGSLELTPEGLVFSADPAASATVDGATPAGPVALKSDAEGTASVIASGTLSVQLIERAGRKALRVRDSEARTRTGFAGIPYFPVDPSWRIEARFERHPEPRTIEVATVVGTLEAYPNPGRIVFERDGRTHQLEALVEEGSAAYFVIFADRTSGRESYGMARYLYAGPEQGETINIDFNRAYNPPCAFTAYATCPMPPEGNRLDLAVRAGERKYEGPGH
jgi:uncharacterized protein (DUF1684 family)